MTTDPESATQIISQTLAMAAKQWEANRPLFTPLIVFNSNESVNDALNAVDRAIRYINEALSTGPEINVDRKAATCNSLPVLQGAINQLLQIWQIATTDEDRSRAIALQSPHIIYAANFISATLASPLPPPKVVQILV